jgi:hypothetical protein
MKRVAAFEGIVENGRIKLPDDVVLPDHVTVYVIVPSLKYQEVHIYSPHLADPSQAGLFTKEVIKDVTDP